jgi:putative addiction module component (TIGR02574 family)
MSTAEIRQQLHDYIDSAEKKKLEAIYTLLENELSDNNVDLTDAQKNELDRRYNDHLNGIGRTYTWDETVAMARHAAVERKGSK